MLRSKVPGMNPELSFALRLRNMLRLALVTAKGAQLRTESRGAHYRSDYPLRNDHECVITSYSIHYTKLYEWRRAWSSG